MNVVIHHCFQKHIRQREGYPENNITLHTSITAKQFIEASDPVDLLSTSNKVQLQKNNFSKSFLLWQNQVNLSGNTTVIRRNGESQNGRYKQTKHANFPQNKHFLPSDTHICIVCVSGGEKCPFFRILGVLCFLVTMFRFISMLSSILQQSKDGDFCENI